MSNKRYLTNPITEELIREGIIVTEEVEETRIITDEEGKQYKEVAVTIRYKDPRKFIKAFPDVTTKYLQMFEGNSKAQMPYILDAAIEKSINKDYVWLSHRDVVKICEERGIEEWSPVKLSRNISWFVENGILFRVQDELGKYFINTKYMYNGMFARQLGLQRK